MKLNFKKIASVLTSTVMLSSTVALAAAANYPAPFVRGGVADVAIVHGINAAQTDMVAVAEINTALSNALSQQGGDDSPTTESTTSVEGGDYVKLQKTSNVFNLGENIGDFYSKLTDEELSVVLADGVYWNNMNEDFDYTQEIELDDDAVLEHFVDKDFNDEQPVIGFNLNAGDHILNYTLEFSDEAEGGTDYADLASTTIEMLGKTFFVSEVEEVSDTHVSMTLLDAANTAILKESETTEVMVGDEKYEVSVETLSDGGSSDDTVRLNVNGQSTRSLAPGQTYPLKDGAFLGITDVSYSDKKDGIVEFSIGTGKIILEHEQEVQVNDDDISDIEDANGYTSVVTAYIVNDSDNNIASLTLSWELDDDAWVAKGTELVMPGFNTIKLSMGDFVTPSVEETVLEDDAGVMTVSTTVKDGEVDIPVLYLDDGKDYFAGVGADSDEQLVVNRSSDTASSTVRLSIANESYFVATWISGDEAESTVLQITDISEGTEAGGEVQNETTLKNLANGETITLTENGDDDGFGGEIKLVQVAASEDGDYAVIRVERDGSSGNIYTDRVVTDEGLQFKLPVLNLTGTLGQDQFGPGNISWVMNFSEENSDDEIAVGSSFTATLGIASDDGTQVTLTSIDELETEEDSDIFEGYAVSALATKIVFETPETGLNTFTVNYHGSEVFADVVLAETGAVVTSDGVVITPGGVSPLGAVIVTDTQAATVESKNIIVIGGSCINSVAATLLGSTSPLCGADFEAKTGAGTGEFVIQTFAWKTGKVATLVAGYNAGDTTNAATYLRNYPVDTTVGKKYLGTSATTAALQASAA